MFFLCKIGKTMKMCYNIIIDLYKEGKLMTTTEEARKMILRKGVSLPPKYRPNKWKYAINSGCYPYAINLFVDKFLLVGDLIGKRCNDYVSDERLISVLEEELEEIGYNVSEIDVDDVIAPNELKIYLQRNEHTGFYHFLRQDKDGLWSHKFPNELPTRKDSAGYDIVDPEMMVDTAFIGWCFRLKKRM